jgi:hypothetical protein
VMSEEARRIVSCWPDWRDGHIVMWISLVPSRTLSAVGSDTERCSRRPQGNVAASPANNLIDRAS